MLYYMSFPGYGYYPLPTLPGSRSLTIELDAGEVPGTYVMTTHQVVYHWRSRGQHDPGSGEYINRYVTGGYVADNNYVVAYDGDKEVGDFKHPSGSKPWEFIYAHLDAGRWIWIQSTLRSPTWHDGKYMRRLDYQVLIAFCDPIFSVLTRHQHQYKEYKRVDTDWYATDDDYSYIYSQVLNRIHTDKLRFRNSTYDHPSMVMTLKRAISAPRSAVLESHLPKPDPIMDNLHDRLDLDPGLIGIRKGLAYAYIDACDKLPQLDSMNNIANVLDILSLLKSLFIERGLVIEKGGKLVRSAWMGYRYAYSTTKADLEEITSYVDRCSALLGSTCVRSNGFYNEESFTVKCSITMNLDALAGLRTQLDKLGMSLTPYKAWDLVPYSFVVDWFLSIGDWLEIADKRSFAAKCKPEDMWFSIRRDFTNQYGFAENYYWRFSGYAPATSDALYTHASSSPSGITIAKRAVDALCMFT